MKEWTTMRGEAFDVLETRYGKMSSDNHSTFIKEMKRLERIWKKDKEQFKAELEKF